VLGDDAFLVAARQLGIEAPRQRDKLGIESVVACRGSGPHARWAPCRSPDPVFNEQGWGGYLIYRWYPERRVFIDGRIDMYGQEIVREYLQVATVRPEWREVLDKYGVRRC
jgi:hypothetical protein